MVNKVKVPPDGGYGWVIVVAGSLSNFINMPMMLNFGLIFKDTFAEMGLSATQGSLIINLNVAFGMILGLLNGFLLKVLGYRKVALIAELLIFIGIILTSFATTFTHFIIAYGIITSAGFGMTTAAYNLAINAFFRNNKSKAIGYNMTILGLGGVVMPQLMKYLMNSYGVQGATFILAAVTTHSFATALLLRPLKWYMIDETVEDEDQEDKDETTITLNRSASQVETKNKNSEALDEMENASIYNLDSDFTGSVMSLYSVKRKMSTVSQTWRKHSVSKSTRSTTPSQPREPSREKSAWKNISERIVSYFDLDLLKDPIYINILIGLSIAIFAEINFSVLTAFILAEMDLSTDQIATFLSIAGVADIICRFLAPYIGDLLNLSARPMYLLTLVLLISTRFTLLLSDSYVVLLGVAVGLGGAKGIRVVHMNLVLPTYVPIEKLASAMGLQMMINGFCVIMGGPIIGYIRDVTGNYNTCILILNCVTFTTLFMWTLEAIIVRSMKKKEQTEQTDTLLDKK